MEKTILEWFDTIPDPEIRERAKRNYDAKFDPEAVVDGIKDLPHAIAHGFAWSDTSEYWRFWDKFSDDPRLTFAEIKHLIPGPSNKELLDEAVELLKRAKPFTEDPAMDLEFSEEIESFLSKVKK